MTKKKFCELLAMTERLGINTLAELAHFKRSHGAETNEELCDALFMSVIKKEMLKGA